jgi:lysophospholipase L1-like esterase
VSPFDRSVAATSALLVLLLALEQLHPSRRRAHVPAAVGALVHDLVRHGASEEEELGLQAGYYDELFDASRAATRSNDPEVEWRRAFPFDESHRRVADFLLYELKPDLDFVAAGGERIVTNSFGMADRPCMLAKPPRTRRIAFLGDSLVRGLGAPFGRALEPRFEEWLAATQRDDKGGSYEVLNFGVEGYRLTQILDVACRRVPPFQPDALLLGLSDLGAARHFAWHLARLVHDGIDLRYPFLKEMVARAGVRPGESFEESDTRLLPLRREVLGGCLREMQTCASALHAPLVALLIPTVEESDRLAGRFVEVRELLRGLAIPTLDLLDTFAHAADLGSLRVSRVDHHPNEAGYGLLLERLKVRLAADPETATLLLGHPVR